MKKKGFLSVLLAAAMVGSMIAAVPVAAESNDETLTVWCWDPNFNIYAMKQAEAEYQKDHPNFKLDIQENVYSDIETKLITAATSGDYSTLPNILIYQKTDRRLCYMAQSYMSFYRHVAFQHFSFKIPIDFQMISGKYRQHT